MYLLNIENRFSATIEEDLYERRMKEIARQKRQLFHYFLRRAGAMIVYVNGQKSEIQRIRQILHSKAGEVVKIKEAEHEYSLLIRLSAQVVGSILENEEVFNQTCCIHLLDAQEKTAAIFHQGAIFYEAPSDLPAVDYERKDSEPKYLTVFTDSEADGIEVKNAAHTFHICGEADDYVKATEELAKALAKELFDYPFYLHFEAYDDMKEELMREWQPQNIRYQHTNRTVLTMTNGCTYHAEVPAFSLAIHNEEELEEFLAELFYLPAQNEAFTLSQRPHMTYCDGYQSIDLKDGEAVIAFGHDAQGCIVYSNKECFSKLAHIKRTITNGWIVEFS
ncbi:hypothetical protein [Bacillus xiapuensis]|uniref:hypothetical protein n=1 Tax=Bacillus xiapuensis TaxID=2014075 RepID=UPI000C245CF1|nr:hypothetical protein [Bacillus xiapuensis]